MREMLDELLVLARQVAELAAVVHRSVAREHVTIDSKSSASDLVTTVDREAERQMVSAIRRARPEDAILGEEGTKVDGTSGVCWVLDPLDGTTNFIHGYPAHSVSLGVEIEGKRAIGVVCDTFQQQVYEGVVGKNARLDNKLINPSAESELAKALIGTGFLPSAKIRSIQADVLREVLPHVRDIRRSGCPSLDLCAVACGRLDGFFESGLGRWDISAGAAIAEAAGATVLELDSTLLPGPLLVVSNAELVKELVAILVRSGAAVDPGAPQFDKL